MDNKTQIKQNEISKHSNAEVNKAEVTNPKINKEEELKRMCLIIDELKFIPTYLS